MVSFLACANVEQKGNEPAQTTAVQAKPLVQEVLTKEQRDALTPDQKTRQ